MGQALLGPAESLSPLLRKNRAVLLDQNGREINYDEPAGATASGESYTPDETAYASDPKNSPVVQFAESAKAGKASVEAYLLCEHDDERTMERVVLTEAQVKDAVTAGHADTWLGEALCRVQNVAVGQLKENLRAAYTAHQELLSEAALREDFDNGDDAPSLTTQGGTGMSPPSPDEVLPLGNGPFNQQLYLYDRWDMLAKSFWAASHDPVADAALEIIVNFTIGRGFTVTCKDPLVQKEWDAFWKLNKGPSRVHTWLYDWFRDGDNFTRFVEQGSKPALIAMLEPSTILEVVADPENLDDVKYYHQQYQSAYQIYTAQDAPGSRYIMRQIPPNEVIHSKLNCSTWEKFGRSDLFPILGWLKRLRDYFTAETMKAIVQAAYTYDYTIKGSGVDVGTVQAYASQNPPPNLLQQGQALYHNDAVEVKPLQADRSSTSSGGIGIGDGLLGIIAIGMHIAKDYLGVTSRGARATAVVAETPAVKHFEGRQRVVRHWIEAMAEKAFYIALKEGRLPKTVVRPANGAMVKECIKTLRSGDIMGALQIFRDIIHGGNEVPIDLGIEVTFPDIVKGDRKQTLLDAEKAESNNWISKKRAANIAAGAFDLSGYEFDDEQNDIAEEGRTVISRAGQQVPKGLPLAGDPAWAPGDVPDPSYTAPGDDAPADDNPAGNGAANIRNENRGARAKESLVRRAVRKTISFVIGK